MAMVGVKNLLEHWLMHDNHRSFAEELINSVHKETDYKLCSPELEKNMEQFRQYSEETDPLDRIAFSYQFAEMEYIDFIDRREKDKPQKFLKDVEHEHIHSILDIIDCHLSRHTINFEAANLPCLLHNPVYQNILSALKHDLQSEKDKRRDRPESLEGYVRKFASRLTGKDFYEKYDDEELLKSLVLKRIDAANCYLRNERALLTDYKEILQAAETGYSNLTKKLKEIVSSYDNQLSNIRIICDNLSCNEQYIRGFYSAIKGNNEPDFVKRAKDELTRLKELQSKARSEYQKADEDLLNTVRGFAINFVNWSILQSRLRQYQVDAFITGEVISNTMLRIAFLSDLRDTVTLDDLTDSPLCTCNQN